MTVTILKVGEGCWRGSMESGGGVGGEGGGVMHLGGGEEDRGGGKKTWEGGH